MFQIGEKSYELKYGIGRVKLIESAAGSPVMSALANSKGMLSLSMLENCFSYGLKESGSDIYVPPKAARECFEQYLTENGYANTVTLVLENLERDCPFFFQAD